MVQLSHYSARAFAICASVLMTSAVSRAEQISQTLNNNPNNGAMAGTFTLPALPYAYDALEPHVDALTMEIHHSKHHQTYVNNLNNLLKGTELTNLEIDDLVTRLEELIEQVPAANRTGVRNNAGGHSNHSFFWKQLKVGTTLDGDLKTAIERDFGSVEEFKKQFEKAATSVFGSGWAWLTLHNGTLKVVTTANQDSPLSGKAISGAEGTPIIGLDVWEHAYYLKYQNRRPDYIAAFWSVVNWEYAKQKFAGLSCPSN